MKRLLMRCVVLCQNKTKKKKSKRLLSVCCKLPFVVHIIDHFCLITTVFMYDCYLLQKFGQEKTKLTGLRSKWPLAFRLLDLSPLFSTSFFFFGISKAKQKNTVRTLPYGQVVPKSSCIPNIRSFWGSVIIDYTVVILSASRIFNLSLSPFHPFNS